jgi:hypothetical protein
MKRSGSTSFEILIAQNKLGPQFDHMKEGPEIKPLASVTHQTRAGQVLAAGSKVGYHHRSLTGRFGGGSFG